MGVILLVAAILGAVVLAVPGDIAGSLRSAVCRALADSGLTEAECEDGVSTQADPEEEIDYSPDYCVRDGRKETYGYSLELGIFSLGQEYSYAREDLSDGSVIITFVPKTEAGVATGVGYDFGDDNGVSTGANIEGGFSAKIAPGSTFVFDSEAEFEEFEDEVNNAIIEEQQRMMNPEGEMGKALAELLGLYERPEVIDPHIRTATLETERYLSGSLGAWSTDPDKKPGQDAGGINLNIGAEGSVSISEKMDLSRWYLEEGNDQVSKTYTYTATGDLGATYLGAHAGGELGWSGATRIMRNEDGSLANIRYMTTVEGEFSYGADVSVGQGNSRDARNYDENGGGVEAGKKERRRIVQMVQMDFDTPEEQEIGEAMLESRGLVPPANVLNSMANPFMDDSTGGEINRLPGLNAAPWDRHFYNKGRAWQYSTGIDGEAVELSAKLKLGLQFGVSGGWAMQEQHTSDAQILDAPSNGERRFVEYPPCISEEEG